jgi:type II secretory pathway predicted ATPase ExeA
LAAAEKVEVGMYERSFGLKEKPFSLTPDPHFLFLSSNHRGALDHLLYGIKRREGFLVITGDIGTGKTTICRALLDRLQAEVRTALILNPMLKEEEELLAAVLQDFGLVPPLGASCKELADRLNFFLLEWARQGWRGVLIIDEAQNLSSRLLEQIRVLSNLETDKEKLLQIILVGQRELQDKLASAELRQLNQRISIRYHLGPLSREETARYIEHRLTVAGASGGIEFTSGTYRAIYRFSRGIPRLINLIADRALLSAYVAGSSRITKAMVVEGRRSLSGEAVSDAFPRWIPRSPRLKVAVLTLCFSLLFGALFAGISQQASGSEGWWSAIAAHLPFGLAPQNAAVVAETPAAHGLGLATMPLDPALPYTIWALATQEGKLFRTVVRSLEEQGLQVFVGDGSGERGVRRPLLVGRFKTPKEAHAAMKKIQDLEGLERVEVIQTAFPLPHQEG